MGGGPGEEHATPPVARRLPGVVSVARRADDVGDADVDAADTPQAGLDLGCGDRWLPVRRRGLALGGGPATRRPEDVDARGGVLPALPQALRTFHRGHRLAARDLGIRASELEARQAPDQTVAAVANDEPRHPHVALAFQVNGHASLIRVESTDLDPAADLDAELRRALTEDPLDLAVRNLEIRTSRAKVTQAGIVHVDRVGRDLTPAEVADGRRLPRASRLSGLGKPPEHRLQRGKQAAPFESLRGG